MWNKTRVDEHVIHLVNSRAPSRASQTPVVSAAAACSSHPHAIVSSSPLRLPSYRQEFELTRNTSPACQAAGLPFTSMADQPGLTRPCGLSRAALSHSRRLHAQRIRPCCGCASDVQRRPWVMQLPGSKWITVQHGSLLRDAPLSPLLTTARALRGQNSSHPAR